MRGPNRKYDCTAGPNGTQCRYCTLRRIRRVNIGRRKARREELPIPALPPSEAPCQCKPCADNRQRVLVNRQNAKTVIEDRDELDLRALERWNPEWGARA